MDFSTDEPASDIVMHCMHGLDRQQLMGQFCWGAPPHLNDTGRKQFHDQWQEVDQEGTIVAPTSYGIDFFLWAMGDRTSDAAQFLNPELQIAEVPGITIGDSASIVVQEAS